MTSGVDDDATIARQPRRLQAYRTAPAPPARRHESGHACYDLFGTTYNSPIFTCPTGGQKSFHPDGELAVARADKARGTLQFLSTATSTSVEDVNAALGRPVWYQVYAPRTWEGCEKLLAPRGGRGMYRYRAYRGHQPGAAMRKPICATRPKDLRQCAACHDVKGEDVLVRNQPMRDGIDAAGGVPLRWTGPLSIACANSGRENSSSRV